MKSRIFCYLLLPLMACFCRSQLKGVDADTSRNMLPPSWESIRYTLQDTIAEMTKGAVPHNALVLFNNVETVGSAAVELSRLISRLPPETQSAVVESVVVSCDDGTRPICAYYLSRNLPCAAFSRRGVQEWLVSDMTRDMFIPWAFPLLSADYREKAISAVCADARRFSESAGIGYVNLARLISVAYAASLGDGASVEALENMLGNATFDSALTSRYVPYAAAISCEHRLLGRLFDIASTNTLAKWNGADCIPRESSLGSIAAHACGIVVKGFPQMKQARFGADAKDYDKELRPRVQKWVSSNGNVSYDVGVDYGRLFMDTPFSVLEAPIARILMGERLAAEKDSANVHHQDAADVQERLERLLRELDTSENVTSDRRVEPPARTGDNKVDSNAGSDLSPEEIDVRLPKKAIADAILQWPKEGTEFFLTYENKQCYRDGKMDMPMRHAFVFGLVPANVLFSSVVTPHETQDEDGETLYFYDAISPSARRRSTYMNSDFYYPQFSLEKCVCRIVFAHREVSPDFSYLQALTMPLKNGKCEKLSPANVWDVRGIEESKYMSEFSNRVFKICRIGFFGIPFASAVAFVNNTATRQDDAKELRIEPTPKTAHLNVLDPREISEVVYWLWKRKGKTDEYAGFVKAHPELFEPIAGEEEFRTELGRRLIGTWK